MFLYYYLFLIISERESFAEYKKRYNIQNILPDVPTDDDDESDDERLGLTSHDFY